MGTTRKPVVLTMSALGAIALLSVGFASWEIRDSSISTEGSGSLNADTVVDKRLQIKDAKWQDDSKIYFGCEKDDTINNPWLTNTSDTTNQSLSAKYEFNVICPADKVNNLKCTVDSSSFTAKGDNDSTDAWNTAINSKYISGPTFDPQVDTSGATGYTTGYSAEDNMKSVPTTVTITFAWGEAFNGSNPYKYYNSSDFNDNLATEALNALNAIYALNGYTFSFTITVSLS